MDYELYKKGIDECSSFGLYSIRLSWRGEPTLHPRLPDMVRYARNKGIKEVSFISNGVKLSGSFAEDLVRSGLDYFSVSIDGTHGTYEKIRYPSKFADIVEKLRTIRELRDTIGRGFPRIRINSIWSAVAGRTEEYFSIFGPIVDYITINPDYDYSLKNTAIDPNHVCQYLYQRMTVMWDGAVPLCICDKSKEVVLGNLADDSICSMWHGSIMQQCRRRQLEGKTRTISPCAKCQRSLTPQVGDQKPKTMSN
jgi:MoaA/NifB/PqqE/SkfB family radical SAM enzyme